MISDQENDKRSEQGVWIISAGKRSTLDLSHIAEDIKAGTVREYEISELASYMLNPKPVEVEKKLVGCKIHYRQPASYMMRQKIRKLIPPNLRPRAADKPIKSEVHSASQDAEPLALSDVDLQWHLENIESLLKPYHPLLQNLAKLDRGKIADLIGICEDRGGSRTWLKLKGSIDDKINYLNNFLFENVGVVLEKVQVSEGLFEMTGFDFTFYKPLNSYRLVRFHQNGSVKACVLDADLTPLYWIDDPRLIHYLVLLQQSMSINPNLDRAFQSCVTEPTRPYRIFFNRQLKIDYSKTYLPEVYRELLQAYRMGPLERDMVMNSLNSRQFGISFNYLVQSDSGEEQMHTSTTVMHDVRALESLKTELPRVYTEIRKRACVSDVGSFYLLDSLKGDADGYGL